VFYAPTVLETNVGLSKDTSLVVGGCINLAFAIGSIVPSIGLDKMGRRKPMMIGSFGMGLSMMMIAILLSFDKPQTSKAAIAFFITVSDALCAFINDPPLTMYSSCYVSARVSTPSPGATALRSSL
jgi:MFS family permease